MAELISFNWTFNKSGYEIVEAATLVEPGQEEQRVKGKFLIRKPPFKEVSWNLHLRGGALFQEFAELEPTEVGVLAFANKYGLLCSTGHVPLGFDATQQRHDKYIRGEQLDHWFYAIGHMRRVTFLWNIANAEDTKSLAKHVVWLENGSIGLRERSDSGVTRTDTFSNITVDSLRPLKPGDLIKPVRALVAEFVNLHLSMSAGAKLSFLPDAKNGQGETVLRLSPGDLLGAMWFQFAQALIQDDRYFACEVCGSWYVAKRMRGSKPVRRTCGGRCRTAKSRKSS